MASTEKFVSVLLCMVTENWTVWDQNFSWKSDGVWTVLWKWCWNGRDANKKLAEVQCLHFSWWRSFWRTLCDHQLSINCSNPSEKSYLDSCLPKVAVHQGPASAANFSQGNITQSTASWMPRGPWGKICEPLLQKVKHGDGVFHHFRVNCVQTWRLHVGSPTASPAVKLCR